MRATRQWRMHAAAGWPLTFPPLGASAGHNPVLLLPLSFLVLVEAFGEVMRNMASCSNAFQGIQWQFKPTLSMESPVTIVITGDRYLPIRQMLEDTVLVRGRAARTEKAHRGSFGILTTSTWHLRGMSSNGRQNNFLGLPVSRSCQELSNYNYTKTSDSCAGSTRRRNVIPLSFPLTCSLLLSGMTRSMGFCRSSCAVKVDVSSGFCVEWKACHSYVRSS